MHNNDIWKRIQLFNQGRDPERLALKYQAMRKDCFTFFRGTNHLFYEDWPRESPLNNAPLAWVSGDLHLENFGTYKGDNRLCYFDINDFDEALLAPCTWDLARFLCSLLLAAQRLKLDQDDAIELCDLCLQTYRHELRECKARWIERNTASGMIRDLLRSLKHRSRSDLLRERTVKHHGQRLLKVDGKKALPVHPADRRKVETLVGNFAANQADPRFFQVMDIARRIAGTGSLGLERYVVLVRGKKGKKPALLDLKIQPGSALAAYVPVQQPAWNSEAERVVTLQSRGLAIAPAFLTAIGNQEQSFLIKELMPHQDRLNLENWQGKFKRLQNVIQSMAELIAWQHIRTGGWRGSAIADDWQAFGCNNSWQKPLLDYAKHYSQQVGSDWLSFKAECF